MSKFPTIEKFLREAFPNTTMQEDEYDLSDYSVIEILLKRKLRFPKNRLIPFSIYGEKGCGKSVFAKLLKEIFKDNLAIVDQERFISSFNHQWVDKKIVVIDEISFTSAVLAKVKRLSRLAYIDVIKKGEAVVSIPNAVTFVMLSNNEEFHYVSDRYSYFQIKMEKPSVIDFDAMVREVPEFVKYLKKRL